MFHYIINNHSHFMPPLKTEEILKNHTWWTLCSSVMLWCFSERCYSEAEGSEPAEDRARSFPFPPPVYDSTRRRRSVEDGEELPTGCCWHTVYRHSVHVSRNPHLTCVKSITQTWHCLKRNLTHRKKTRVGKSSTTFRLSRSPLMDALPFKLHRHDL